MKIECYKKSLISDYTILGAITTTIIIFYFAISYILELHLSELDLALVSGILFIIIIDAIIFLSISIAYEKNIPKWIIPLWICICGLSLLANILIVAIRSTSDPLPIWDTPIIQYTMMNLIIMTIIAPIYRAYCKCR